MRIRQNNSAVVKFGKNITKGGALALRVSSMEVPVAEARARVEMRGCQAPGATAAT